MTTQLYLGTSDQLAGTRLIELSLAVSQREEEFDHEPQEADENVGIETVLGNDFARIRLDHVWNPSQEAVRQRVRALPEIELGVS